MLIYFSVLFPGSGRQTSQNDGRQRDCQWGQGWGPGHSNTRPHWLAAPARERTGALCQVGWIFSERCLSSCIRGLMVLLVIHGVSVGMQRFNIVGVK